MILALQSAGKTTHLQLLADTKSQQPAAILDWDSDRALADELHGQIIQFLASHSAGLADLTGIIVFRGPGSFTSLRIGHTVANALADSLGIPVVGAMGDDWVVSGQKLLQSAKPGIPVLPHYGAEANITKPKS